MSIPSPCIDVCAIDETNGFCKGCYRTLDEIACWMSLSDAQQLHVINKLAQRRSAASAHKD